MDPYETQRKWESRSEMAAIRAVGNGSRGGPGAAKRRKKKAKPRRLSARQAERREDTVKLIAENAAQKLFAECRSQTEDLLLQQFKMPRIEEMQPAAFWKTIADSDNRALVRHANKKYLDAIVFAYAVYVWVVGSEPWKCELHINMISEKAGKSITPKFDLLRTILQLVIDYDDNDSEQHKLNRKYWSRDAQAIRWLISNNIPPHNVKSYQKDHGGGVDEWSRLASKTATADSERIATDVDVREARRRWKRDPGWEALDDYLDDVVPEPTIDEKPRVTRIDNVLLRYFSEKKGLRPGEGLMVIIVDDPAVPEGMRIVRTDSLGKLHPPGKKLNQELAMLFRAARVLIGGRPKA